MRAGVPGTGIIIKLKVFLPDRPDLRFIDFPPPWSNVREEKSPQMGQLFFVSATDINPYFVRNIIYFTRIHN